MGVFSQRVLLEFSVVINEADIEANELITLDAKRLNSMIPEVLQYCLIGNFEDNDDLNYIEEDFGGFENESYERPTVDDISFDIQFTIPDVVHEITGVDERKLYEKLIHLPYIGVYINHIYVDVEKP